MVEITMNKQGVPFKISGKDLAINIGGFVNVDGVKHRVAKIQSVNCYKKNFVEVVGLAKPIKIKNKNIEG